MPRDFGAAREKARNAGREAVGDQLDQITEQADGLEGIFDGLKLTDRGTYDALTKIVEEASAKNESIASVIERVKELGAEGAQLAGKIANLSSGGSLAAVKLALKI
jgi:hypothetical protein